MLTQQLITENIPPIKLADTGVRVLRWMDEFKVNHLPIVEGGEYIGLISDADVFFPLQKNPSEIKRLSPKNYSLKKINIFLMP